LSAPFDPNEEKPISTIQSGGPPPTAVLPADSGSKETETKPAPLPPTIASPALSPGAPEAKPFAPPLGLSTEPRKNSMLVYIAISLVALILLLGGIAAVRRSQCPKVIVDCKPSVNVADQAFCYLDYRGISRVTWSTSSGSLYGTKVGETYIDTTGLSGRTITVTARFTADSWFCSNTPSTASTSFVAP